MEVTILSVVVRVELTEEKTAVQVPIWLCRVENPGRKANRCKLPEVGVCLACSQNSQECSVAET